MAAAIKRSSERGQEDGAPTPNEVDGQWHFPLVKDKEYFV